MIVVIGIQRTYRSIRINRSDQQLLDKRAVLKKQFKGIYLLQPLPVRVDAGMKTIQSYFP